MEDEAEAAAPRRRGAVIVLVILAIGAAAIAGAWMHANRRVEVGTDTRCLFPDGRRVVVRRFRGPAPERELQLRDASLRVVWSAPLERPVDALYALDDGVLYEHRGAIVVRDLDDGAIRWSAPIDAPWEYGASLSFRMLEEDVLEILDEPYGNGVLVRRRALGTGTALWSTDPLVVPADARLGWWWYDGDLFFDAESALARIDLATGAVEQLTPEGAVAACYTTAESIYVDASWHAWIRPFGGTPRELGWLAPGRLACARAEGRLWVEWGYPGVARYDEPFEPSGALTTTPGFRAAQAADGAVFVLTENGELVWGLESAWGAPRFGIERPSEAHSAFVPPRASPGRLVLHFEESMEGHEETDWEGGRSADVVVDEATGRVL